MAAAPTRALAERGSLKCVGGVVRPPARRCTTRTAYREALVVTGTGYDVDVTQVLALALLAVLVFDSGLIGLWDAMLAAGGGGAVC
jgi:hypothetical protein